MGGNKKRGRKGVKGPNAKTQQKKQKKYLEDKTFGLKNKKKSKKVQNYIKGVKAKVTQISEKRLIAERYRKKQEKEENERKSKMLAQMFGGYKKQAK